MLFWLAALLTSGLAAQRAARRVESAQPYAIGLKHAASTTHLEL